jgi:hypothetical protein
MNDLEIAALKLAMRKAFNLGATYWQQADSEYSSQWRKADETKARLAQLVEETIAAIKKAEKNTP